MATRESSGAEGKILLKFDFYESASGHIEDDSRIELLAKDKNTLVLVESESHTEYLKSNRDSNEKEQYEIKVDDLIKLIEQNGTKI